MFALFKKTKHLLSLVNPDGEIIPNSIHIQLMKLHVYY